MTAIVKFINKHELGSVFDDHATRVMGQAFDSACKDLHDKGQPNLVYEVIANRITQPPVPDICKRLGQMFN